MSNKNSLFVLVGENIFDLNSITNIGCVGTNIHVYIRNNSVGVPLTSKEYHQLLNYFFPHKYISPNYEIPEYILVGNNMFNTNLITHALHNNEKSLVFVNKNPNGMPITYEEYQLLIKYLLAR